MCLSYEQVAEMYRRQGRVVPQEFHGAKELKAHKYNARKKEVDGIVFDSTSEAEAYRVIKQWERAGAISDLRMQPAFTLQERFRDARGRTIREITYSADFRFFDISQQKVRHIDVKGRITSAFLKSMKQMKDRYPNVEIELWDRNKVRELARM